MKRGKTEATKATASLADLFNKRSRTACQEVIDVDASLSNAVDISPPIDSTPPTDAPVARGLCDDVCTGHVYHCFFSIQGAGQGTCSIVSTVRHAYLGHNTFSALQYLSLR